MGNFEFIKIKNEDEIIETSVPIKKDGIYYLSGNEEYWLVSAGKKEDLQNLFIKKGIIGIGWDKISIDDLKNLSEKELKKIIELKYSFLLEKKYKNKSNFKRYISSTTKKMKRFLEEMKLGDIIVLKDKGSNRLYFGKIISECENYFDKDLFIDNVSGYCNKIRRVKWLISKDRNAVGAELKLVLRSRHAISSLKTLKVQDEVNREMFSYYYKGSNLHAIFEIKLKHDIPHDTFLELQNFMHQLKNEVLKTKKVENNFSIKANIQSPGPVEFFGNPEIIKYIFSSTVGFGISGGVYFGIKKLLKIENPKKEIKEIEDKFKEGN